MAETPRVFKLPRNWGQGVGIFEAEGREGQRSQGLFWVLQGVQLVFGKAGRSVQGEGVWRDNLLIPGLVGHISKCIVYKGTGQSFRFLSKRVPMSNLCL